MPIKSAEDLLTAELRDIYSAEKQLSRALPKLQKAVSSSALRDALDKRREEGSGVLETLDAIFQETETRPGRKKCEAMEGLIEEANEHVEEIDDDRVLDAALIGALQRVEHYCIASWGTAAGIAKALGHDGAAQRLSDLIANGRGFDEALTQLAETEINPAMLGAEDEDEADEDLDEEEGEDEESPAPTRAKPSAPRGARKTATRREAGQRS